MGVTKLIATHDCCRCIALLDKYYGHQHYCLRFAHANLQCQEDDAQSRDCLNLLNNYSREEIETEYILDCLYAELQVQNVPDVQDVLTSSMLEFTWKIGNRSDAYTTEAYRKKLQLFQGLQSEHPGFGDFVDGFVDGDHEKVRKVANSVLFQRIPPRARGSPQGSWAQEAIKSAIQMLGAHTVHSSERWIVYPSIPPRVFRSAEYLDEPPRQLTKPQAATIP